MSKDLKLLPVAQTHKSSNPVGTCTKAETLNAAQGMLKSWVTQTHWVWSKGSQLYRGPGTWAGVGGLARMPEQVHHAPSEIGASGGRVGNLRAGAHQGTVVQAPSLAAAFLFFIAVENRHAR